MLSDLEGRLLLSFSEEFMHLPRQFHLVLVQLPLPSPRVLRQEGCLDLVVKCIQQDIGKNRTHD